jgi:hypothetical protein
VEGIVADEETGKNQEEESTDSFLHSTLGAGTIITAWIFVLGWTYLHVYYTYFGININSLDFPVYHYLTFFFTQFVSFELGGLFLGALILAVFALAWFGNIVRRRINGVVVGLGFLALFWLGFHVSEANAARAAKEDMAKASTLPQIAIELKEQHTFVDGDVEAILGSSDLRLLLEDKDHLFVFVPVDLKRHPLYVNTVSIDKSEVISTLRTVRVK